MATLSVMDFYSVLLNKGLAKPTLYEVIIPGMDQEGAMYCSTMTKPGKNLTPRNTFPHGIGITTPQGATWAHEQTTLTFYLSENHYEYQFFEEWMNRVYSNDNKRLNYLDTYVEDIDIKQVDRANNTTYECTLIDAFPTNYSNIEYGYGLTDSVQTFNVLLSFYDKRERFF